MVQQMLIDVLQKTISQNPADQKQALDVLQQGAESNFPNFVTELSTILHSVQCESFVRQAAGLQLKNVLRANEDTRRNAYLQRWMQLTAEVRQHVKMSCLSTLGTEPFRPSIAAQCVAAIACAELPSGLWPDVIASLMNGVAAPGSTEQLKEASLEALGYICQDIDSRVLEAQANQILTAIVQGMRKEEQSNHVRLAATNALFNSLEFTSENFSNDPERHVIMQVCCEATQSPDLRVKVAALQCLVRIMSLYYQFMETYMAAALYPITVQAMKSEESDVSLQGIEFWSNVCEEEIALCVEAQEAEENNRAPERTSRHYAKGATPHVVPLLLDTLVKQDDGDDEDDWTPSKAAGVCVMLLSQCVGDDIIQPVLPFFQNFGNSDWKYKEAAIMAFGSILDGPDPAKLQQLIHQALPMLLNFVADKSLHVSVRDTCGWAIGRVIELCPEIIEHEPLRVTLLPKLSAALGHEPRVANNICWAICSVVKAAYRSAEQQGTDSTGQPDTFVLSDCFEGIVSELIRTTDRPDSNQANLRLSAFETLMEVIKNSPKDCYPVVQNTTVIVLKKLEQILGMENSAASSNDKSQLADLQALLCGMLQSVMRKMRPEDAPAIGQHMMAGLLQIMTRASGKKGNESGNVMEEALFALAALVETLGKQFAQYLELIRPILLASLANYEEGAVVAAAVGVVVDMSRSMETSIAPICDAVMEQLITCLKTPAVNREVKVTILGAFGDIALALGEGFDRYLAITLQMLDEASNATVVTDPDDIDQVDYVDNLREHVTMTYTGLLQGLRGENSENDPNKLQAAKAKIGQFVPNMCKIIELCCTMQPVAPTEGVISAVAGLIGDIVVLYGKDIAQFINKEKVSALLSKGRKAKGSKTKTVCNWATKELRKAGLLN